MKLLRKNKQTMLHFCKTKKKPVPLTANPACFSVYLCLVFLASSILKASFRSVPAAGQLFFKIVNPLHFSSNMPRVTGFHPPSYPKKGGGIEFGAVRQETVISP